MQALNWRSSVAVALLALLAGCVDPPADEGENRPAPPFELPDLASGSLKLSDLKGKVVILDFWATWCGPCIVEIPQYARFWKKNRVRGVEVVGVLIQSGTPEDMQDFVREAQIPYRQLVGTNELAEAYGMEGLPTTFVIDGDGRIREKIVGSHHTKFDKLQELVDELLSRQS